MRKRSNRARVTLILPAAPNRDGGAPVYLAALGVEVPVGVPFEMREDRAEEALRRYADLRRYTEPPHRAEDPVEIPAEDPLPVPAALPAAPRAVKKPTNPKGVK